MDKESMHDIAKKIEPAEIWRHAVQHIDHVVRKVREGRRGSLDLSALQHIGHQTLISGYQTPFTTIQYNFLFSLLSFLFPLSFQCFSPSLMLYSKCLSYTAGVFADYPYVLADLFRFPAIQSGEDGKMTEDAAAKAIEAGALAGRPSPREWQSQPVLESFADMCAGHVELKILYVNLRLMTSSYTIIFSMSMLIFGISLIVPNCLHLAVSL